MSANGTVVVLRLDDGQTEHRVVLDRTLVSILDYLAARRDRTDLPAL